MNEFVFPDHINIESSDYGSTDDIDWRQTPNRTHIPQFWWLKGIWNSWYIHFLWDICSVINTQKNARKDEQWRHKCLWSWPFIISSNEVRNLVKLFWKVKLRQASSRYFSTPACFPYSSNVFRSQKATVKNILIIIKKKQNYSNEKPSHNISSVCCVASIWVFIYSLVEQIRRIYMTQFSRLSPRSRVVIKPCKYLSLKRFFLSV